MEYFLIVSLVCGIVILFTAVITKLLHNKIERKWRYIVWIVLAVRLLIPVDISIPTPVITLELPGVEESAAERVRIPVQGPTTNVVMPQYPSTNTPVENVQPSTPVVPQTPDLSPSVTAPAVTPAEPEFVFEWSMVWDMLPWVWAIGVIISALWYLIGYAYQKHELLRWSYPANGVQLQEKLDTYIEELEIPQRISVKICKKIATPMMVGLFQPILLMPVGSYNMQELDYIFRHELLHIKRRDVWVKALMLAVRVIHWFNPTVMLMSREMNEDIEILCDGQVVKDMGADERRAYNDILLQHLARRREEGMIFSTCFGSRLQKAKDRFVQVSQGGRLRKCYSLCAILLVGVIVGSLLVSCGAAQEESSVKEESSIEESSKEESSEKEESSKKEESAKAEESSKEESSQAKENSQLSTQAALAYMDVVEELYRQYGPCEKGFIQVKDDLKQRLQGLVVTELLDFDGDGQLELYCVYGEKKMDEDTRLYQVIYTYDGELQVLYESEVSNAENLQPLTNLYEKDEQIFMVIESEEWQGQILTWHGGTMTLVHHYDYGFVSGETSWDGEVISYNEMGEKYQQFVKSCTQIMEYWYFNHDHMQRIHIANTQSQNLLEQTSGREFNLQEAIVEVHNSETARMAQEYLTIIENMEKTYDGAYYFSPGGLGSFSRQGTYQLLDFDGDDVPELYCVYRTNGTYWEEVYQYVNGQCKLVWSGNVGVRESQRRETPSTVLIKTEDRAYVRTGYALGRIGQYVTIENHEKATVLSYNMIFHANAYYLNNEVVDGNRLKQAMNDLEAGGQILRLDYRHEVDESEVLYLDALKEALGEAILTGQLDLDGIELNWQECTPRPMWTKTVEEDPDNPLKTAYRQIVDQLEERYGKAYLIRGYEAGVSLVRLVDFDGDGTDELYCAYALGDEFEPLYGTFVQEVYQYRNGRIYCIFQSNVCTYRYQEDSAARFIHYGDKVYLMSGGNNSFVYTAFEDGQVKSVLNTYEEPGAMQWNGESVSDEEFKTRMEAFLAGAEVETYTFYYSYANTNGYLEAYVDDLSEVAYAPEPQVELSEEVRSAYRQVVADLEGQYGKASEKNGQCTGLCMVKLIDFDGDGVAELYCGYGQGESGFPYQEEIYQYQNGQAVMIYQGKVLNRGTSVEPAAQFIIREDKVYIVSGSEFLYEYKTLVSGEMRTEATVYAWDTITWNDEEISREEYDARMAVLIGEGKVESYTYYSSAIMGSTTMVVYVEEI